jgi:UDP-N-acetyl-2-amino-2-deoxyglucuronate dehydrogenase
MADKVRLALVGCGGIAGAHIGGYKDLYTHGGRDFVVTACCDPSQQNAEQRANDIAAIQGTKPKIFESVEALVKAGVAQAADICTPHCFHHSTALPLLEGGMDVLLEKPLGLTVKASRRLIDTAKKHKRILATAENIRRCLAPRACRWALMDRKMIGDVRFVDIQAVGYSPLDFTKPLFKWRGVKLLTGGGMIMDSGAHLTDMMLYMFGEPDEISCWMETFDKLPIEGAPIVGNAHCDVEDTWHAVFTFRSGLRVAWTHSRALPGGDIRHGRYYGSEGLMEDLGWTFHCFQGGGKITLKDGTVRSKDWIEKEYLLSLSGEEKERLFPYGVTDGFAIEVQDFVRAVAKQGTVEMDGVAGLKAKALSEACFESATLGKPVKYLDVLEGRIDAFQKPLNDYWKI